MLNEITPVAFVVFGPLFLFGVAGLWLSFRHLRPLSARLGVSPRNRTVTRNILFAGVTSDDPEIIAMTRQFRVAYAVLFALGLIYAAAVFGLFAVAFLAVFLCLNWLLSKKVECAEVTQ